MSVETASVTPRKPLAEMREKAAAAVRCLILLTVFLMARYREQPLDNPGLDYFLIGASAYVLFTTFLLPRLSRGADTTLPQLALDVLLITGLIYVEGGIRSEYYLLYYLPILHASVRLNFRDAIGASVLSAVAYLFVGVAQGPGSQVVTSALTRALTFAASAGLLACFFGLLARENRNYQRLSQWYREASEAKSQFVSTVSHELRTPLTAIIGFSQIVNDTELEPEKQAEYLGVIKNQAERLAKLIEDLLDLAQIEEGQIRLKPGRVTVSDAIRDSLVAFPEAARAHEVEVEVAPDLPPVWADRDRVIQILTNLISNAMKYSDPGSKVWIRTLPLADASADKSKVAVEVRDEGVGISPEDLPKLFERFYRGANRDGRVRGTGLGLAVVKALVERQEGQVWVRSEPGRGSIFGFSLPACAQESEAPEESARPVTFAALREERAS